ncbi:phosphoric/sulfuric ester hydrolase PehA [Elioraea sp.]|jgi:arylsulfatase A-like enzyme|uniref:phosphoric/sulfuric ester hydrolase PehA n=1 Tax=Elioraea sp. TaxID=2185103 RepID=UPI0021DDDE85|nr:phosphoric/sulfuric ester hydrolase PehA [Elioraea sp.]GIX11833.1 MAG: sulfatase [Elioraea sp.]
MTDTPGASEARAINVLLIVVDQWRADMMPGSPALPIDLPNIRRLMREGVTFRNHVTTAVPCGPARASLLTGLYLMNHRAVQNTVPLDARHFTLARALRAAGYDPALIGYTTTTPDPRTTPRRDPRFTVLGDLMEGFRSVGAFEPGMDGYFGWVAQKGYALPPNRTDIWLPEGEDAVPGATDRPARIPKELSDSAFFTERALTYLKGRDGKPWFLHLGYYRPHPPFVAPAPYHALVKPADVAPPIRAATPEREARQHPLLGFYLGSIAQSSFFQGASGLGVELDEAALRQMRATYCGMLAEIDDRLGEVFAHLDATRQWQDTLVIFTSDHGEQLGDHWLLGKIGYFDESFRIPLIVRDPRAEADVTRGRTLQAFTESIDVMPTILDWLGAEVPRAADGRSLLPLVEGRHPADWRDALTYEFDFRDVYYSHPEAALGLPMDHCSLAVIQDDEAKYVHFAGLPPLFFDLREDPHQFVDRAADPACAARVKDYAQRLLTHRMRHAERTLTHFRATPHGLEERRPAR